mmetsp:Transcript_22153/g.72923  ORF Transcript_22153/g.72923 Transcript_22153/m.72923 type:complete len:201 (-) Transcript_22153:257-859(-)
MTSGSISFSLIIDNTVSPLVTHSLLSGIEAPLAAMFRRELYVLRSGLTPTPRMSLRTLNPCWKDWVCAAPFEMTSRSVLYVTISPVIWALRISDMTSSAPSKSPPLFLAQSLSARLYALISIFDPLLSPLVWLAISSIAVAAVLQPASSFSSVFLAVFLSVLLALLGTAKLPGTNFSLGSQHTIGIKPWLRPTRKSSPRQ